jgi:hypothetical protein
VFYEENIKNSAVSLKLLIPIAMARGKWRNDHNTCVIAGISGMSLKYRPAISSFILRSLYIKNEEKIKNSAC